MEEQRQHRFTGKIKTDRAYLTEIFFGLFRYEDEGYEDREG